MLAQQSPAGLGGREGGGDSASACIKRVGMSAMEWRDAKPEALTLPCAGCRLLNRLKDNVEGRHARFEDKMSGLQQLLTPRQRAKLVLWVTR